MSKKFDPQAIELIDTLIRKARNSQYKDSCAGSCGTSYDYRQADEAEDAQGEARDALIAHLGLEDS